MLSPIFCHACVFPYASKQVFSKFSSSLLSFIENFPSILNLDFMLLL